MKGPPNSFLSQSVYVFAILFSVAVLIVLRLNEVPIHLAFLIILSYFFWFVAVQVRAFAPMVSQPNDDSDHPEFEPNSLEKNYFNALHQSLERNWTMFENDYQHCAGTLKNTHGALSQAIDAAGSTGMLALNAMLAATKTGEVGRGFVTVSKDLVGISEQSIADLNKLKQIVNKADLSLQAMQASVGTNLDEFVTNSASFPTRGMEKLTMQLQECQDGLRQLSDRYQKNLKSDVRWLQMGDAVRRLLNELINTLYQLELRLNDVLSDMRLMKLSGNLNSEQLLEIKGSIATIDGAD